MPELKFVAIDPPEPRRTYIYADREVSVEDVTGVCVRESGTHRVETKGGEKYIIAPGWLAIRLEGVEKWTF